MKGRRPARPGGHGAHRPRCETCGRQIEPVRGGGFMHSDDRRERGDDGHLATMAHHWTGAAT